MSKNVVASIRYPVNCEAGTSYLDDSYMAVRPDFLEVLREIVKYMDIPGECNVSRVALKADRSVAGVMVVSSILTENNKRIRFILGLQGTIIQLAPPLIVLPRAVRKLTLGQPEVHVAW